MSKLLILSDICAPYRIEVFRGLGREFDTDIFFARWRAGAREASWYVHDDDELSFTILTEGDGERLYREALNKITEYDAVLCYDPWIPVARKLQRLCIKKKVPYILNADGAVDINLSFPKKQVKSYFVKRAALCLAGCERAVEYFMAYGAKDSKIARHPFTSLYRESILDRVPSAEEKEKRREELGLHGGAIYLAVGQFIPRKGYDLLLEGWRRAKVNGELYIIGGGPLYEEYQRTIKEKSIQGVHLVGYIDSALLEKYYIAADVFLMPTREDIWGLVVGEAMSRGLPVISSDRCTAANELLPLGGGLIYPVNDIDRLSECIRELVDREKREKMAAAALESVRPHTYENVVASHVEAIKGIISKTEGTPMANKVVLLAPTPPPAGGIASWTVRMMSAELKNDWSVTVVDEKVIGNRQVFGKGKKRNFLTEIKRSRKIWRELKAALTDEGAKVVHSCIPSSFFSMLREYFCAGIAKKKKRKFIMHFRCTVPIAAKGRLARWILPRLCKRCDHIITLNTQTEDFLHQVTKTPTTLIPNFVSAGEVAEAHEIREVMSRVVYVGGVVPTKGAYDILAIAKEMPEIEFRLVGRADPAVEDKARELELNNVVFTGPKEREGVREELEAADVFLFMSYFSGEGFSNALAEAMAVGLPCVATRWAANADMIGDGGGIVVEPKDVGAAIEALRALADPEVRRKASEHNIEKVRREYIDRVVIDKYVDLYERVLGEQA